MFHSQKGFTLVELLLSMIIISGFYYSALITLPKGSGVVKSEAENLMRGLQYINQRSRYEGGVFGLQLSETHWRFYKFCCYDCHGIKDNLKINTKMNCIWQSAGENNILSREYSDKLISKLNVHGEDIIIDNVIGANIKPQLIFSPEEEYSDFFLVLKNEENTECVEIKNNIAGASIFIHK
ncbi:general secretion pathway protein GspH [Yersinia similis]|uniref:General secretion pathway protein GspH n=2 Tax=Yersinia similis TaxID=367190 RepID=A0A0T9PN05_9GAMM|nr:prepilin-type N-terminal cleavage/methylation domain-containing protein [Yersinia similis]AHK18238.1 general secretion pathway protein GspH [Yersinia similis]CFQ56585.1 general secretory pathway proteins G and H [Yersinia similis]CNB48381.1 general secretory pathway proteins G and H [Yersinia similis]CNE84706.1 general secretory pathway proteins G and H [Yersinia similis]CNF68266.1 general secretory pathway proteins G and H [Yersinia similis]